MSLNCQKKLACKENNTEYRSFSDHVILIYRGQQVINFHVLLWNSIIAWGLRFRSSDHVSRVWSFTLELDQQEKFCGRLAREHLLKCEWTMKSLRGGAQIFSKQSFFFLKVRTSNFYCVCPIYECFFCVARFARFFV